MQLMKQALYLQASTAGYDSNPYNFNQRQTRSVLAKLLNTETCITALNKQVLKV